MSGYYAMSDMGLLSAHAGTVNALTSLAMTDFASPQGDFSGIMGDSSLWGGISSGGVSLSDAGTMLAGFFGHKTVQDLGAAALTGIGTHARLTMDAMKAAGLSAPGSMRYYGRMARGALIAGIILDTLPTYNRLSAMRRSGRISGFQMGAGLAINAVGTGIKTAAGGAAGFFANKLYGHWAGVAGGVAASSITSFFWENFGEQPMLKLININL